MRDFFWWLQYTLKLFFPEVIKVVGSYQENNCWVNGVRVGDRRWGFLEVNRKGFKYFRKQTQLFNWYNSCIKDILVLPLHPDKIWPSLVSVQALKQICSRMWDGFESHLGCLKSNGTKKKEMSWYFDWNAVERPAFLKTSSGECICARSQGCGSKSHLICQKETVRSYMS